LENVALLHRHRDVLHCWKVFDRIPLQHDKTGLVAFLEFPIFLREDRPGRTATADCQQAALVEYIQCLNVQGLWYRVAAVVVAAEGQSNVVLLEQRKIAAIQIVPSLRC
jgi:hypothetical protein